MSHERPGSAHEVTTSAAPRYLRRSTLLLRFLARIPDELADFELLSAKDNDPSVRFVRDVPPRPPLDSTEQRVLGWDGTHTYEDPCSALITEHSSDTTVVLGNDDAVHHRVLSYCYEAARLCYVDAPFDAVEWAEILNEDGSKNRRGGLVRWDRWFSESVLLPRATWHSPAMEFCKWPAMAEAIRRVYESRDENTPFITRALWEFARGTEARNADHRIGHFVAAVEAVIQTDQGRSTVQFADELAKAFRGIRKQPHAYYKRLFEKHYKLRSVTAHAIRFLEPRDHRALKHLEWSVRMFLRRLLLDRRFAQAIHRARTERLAKRKAAAGHSAHAGHVAEKGAVTNRAASRRSKPRPGPKSKHHPARPHQGSGGGRSPVRLSRRRRR